MPETPARTNILNPQWWGLLAQRTRLDALVRHHHFIYWELILTLNFQNFFPLICSRTGLTLKSRSWSGSDVALPWNCRGIGISLWTSHWQLFGNVYPQPSNNQLIASSQYPWWVFIPINDLTSFGFVLMLVPRNWQEYRWLFSAISWKTLWISCKEMKADQAFWMHFHSKLFFLQLQKRNKCFR